MMHAQWPLQIRSEQQRVLDQGHGATRLNRRVISKQLMGKDQGDVHSARLSRQTAGPSTNGSGIAAVHLPGKRAQHPGTAIHYHLLAVTLLVVESQDQLPVILGTAGDVIGTDRAGAQSW